MTAAKIARKSPYKIEVQKGKKYLWCACGLSEKQPFCDGSHRTTEFTPVLFSAPETKTLYFCGCKQTGSVPLCDGTHNKI